MDRLTVADLYAGVAEQWATGAELVYAPLADALVAQAGTALVGQVVLDVGAGTGAGTRALQAAGAVPLAADLAFDMLARERMVRPPAVVADVGHLPIRTGSCDGALAAFVLNHVDRPVPVLRELARAVRPGGVILASTFSEADRLALKDLLDAVVARHGWTPPPGYAWMKANTMPLVGSAEQMAAAARDAGLVDVEVFEGPVDVGVTAPRDLVAYRFGAAHVAGYLAELPPAERQRIVAEAEAAATEAHDGSSLAPAVVFLAARTA